MVTTAMCAVAAIAGDFKDLLAPDKAKALPLPEARWRRSDGRADVERCLSGCMRVPQYREAGNGPCSLLTGSLRGQIIQHLDPNQDFALLALRPAGSLSRPRRPLSRGSEPAGRPANPLVSYQINRQVSGWKSPSTGDVRLRGALKLRVNGDALHASLDGSHRPTRQPLDHPNIEVFPPDRAGRAMRPALEVADIFRRHGRLSSTSKFQRVTLNNA